jgi:hypothetical protein
VPDTDPAALVAAIRERNEAWIKSMAFTEATVREMPSGDLRLALAALEAVLGRHAMKIHSAIDPCARCAGWSLRPITWQEHVEEMAACGDCVITETQICSGCGTGWPCTEYQAISCALSGEDGESR